MIKTMKKMKIGKNGNQEKWKSGNNGYPTFLN